METITTHCVPLILFGFLVLVIMLCDFHNLQWIFRKLHLPFSFRVHRFKGLYDDDDILKIYPPSPNNPMRFNVDVNIDGFITKYYGRY